MGSDPDEQQPNIRVSIVIKALNEEERIEAALRSSLAAAERSGGEVILADSASTDDTVAIASRFPVAIVQLKNVEDRRCGAGPQLGYQVARGEYVYILDGDMELDPEFLPAALEVMQADEMLGGVAGLVEEQSDASYQFRGRKRRRHEAAAGDARWLDMGGLYRSAALREVGYFSNRNLHAYEEMDLGLRLNHAGWRLRRLPIRSVRHYGYAEGNWELLKRRWRSRYLDGAGEILRASLNKPWFREVVRSQKHLFVGLAIWIGAIAGLLLLPVTPWLLAAVAVVVFLLIALRAHRAGSVADALFGQVVWQTTSLAMLRGLLRRPVDPHCSVEYVLLKRERRQAAAPSRDQEGARVSGRSTS